MSVTAPAPSAPIAVFISYAHTDERFRVALEAHLSLLQRQGLVSTWYDRKITAGTEWAGQIDQHLDTASIILLLVSADFLASDYCHDVELKRAMERHAAGKARVIPVILRPVDWKGAAFDKLQVLPSGGKPITTWSNRDQAFVDVVAGIRAAVALLGSPERQRVEPRLQTALPPQLAPVALTSFVGREAELAAVQRHLEQARLLTLTGPGGSGIHRGNSL